MKYLFKHKWLIVLLLVFAIATPVISSVMNFMLQALYDLIGVKDNATNIITSLSMLFGVWVFNRLLAFVNTIVQTYLMRRINTDLKRDLFNGTIDMNSAKYDQASDGEYIAMFTNDTLIIETNYYRNIIGIVGSAFSIIVYSISLFRLNIVIAVTIMSVAVVALVIPFIFSSYTNKASLVYSRSIGEFTQSLKNIFNSFLTVKNYGVEEQCRGRFNEANEELERKKFESKFAVQFADAVGTFFAWFMRVACLSACIVLLSDGEISFGTTIAAISFAGELGYPIQDFVQQFNGIRSIRSIVQKNLARATNNVSEVVANADDVLPCDSVKYDNVSLEIDGRIIIDRFDYEFDKGKKYLLIGKNGCGKSTLCKLLKKYYTDYSGTISIDGTDLRDISYNRLSKCVSYMNENVNIIFDTVRDNIILDREYSEEELQNAIELAQLNVDLDRVIGDNGSKVSSGEKRRIEIARTMLKNVPVLILDEIISTLDIETAYEIENLCLGIPDKTMIFISHNFSMRLIDKYDEILLIDGGRLVGHGTHSELLRRNRRYRELIGIKTGENYDHLADGPQDPEFETVTASVACEPGPELAAGAEQQVIPEQPA